MVLDIEEDVNIPLILNRSFLATTSAIIDVKHNKLKFQIGGEAVGS